MKHDIYISASRRDFHADSKIRTILHSVGYTYFHTLDCDMGTGFEQRIKAEIIDSNLFLCILSENAYSSQFVGKELSFALKEKGEGKILLVVIDNSVPSGMFKELTSKLNSIRLNLNETSDAKIILLHEIEKRCGIRNKDIKQNDISGYPQYTSQKIFISYKRIDKDVVFEIKNKIEQQTEVPCWIDIDGIESDAQFINVIIKAINNAEIFLFMYSSAHKQIKDYENDWTIREISYAQKRKKRIVFINIDGSELTDWFEMMFGTRQHICASSEEAMNRLFYDIRNWLK